MKKGINIPADINSNDNLYLLIEISDVSISFLWCHYYPREVIGIELYHREVSESLEDFCKTVLNQLVSVSSSIKKISIRYNFKDALFIPKELYQKSLNQEMLDLMFGENASMVTKMDEIKALPFYNIYRIPLLAEDMIRDLFPSFDMSHSSSHQVDAQVATDQLVCIVMQNHVKVILYKDTQLQIIQQFAYATPADVVYYLLNTCKQHAVTPSEVHLCLKGFIVQDSALYNELHHYFLHISFSLPTAVLPLAPSIPTDNRHFFTHLIELASCE